MDQRGGRALHPGPVRLGVFTGSLALAEALAIRDADGVSVADELHRTGYVGQRPLVCCQL